MPPSDSHGSNSTDRLSPFNRSRQPYHLRKPQLQTSSSDPHRGPRSHAAADANIEGSRMLKRARENCPQTSTDSGTDADDERLTFTKPLPAPPLKPRKGLRTQHTAAVGNVPSPLLTPSGLDETASHLVGDYFDVGAKARSDGHSLEEEAYKVKLRKRRRAEALRRIAEVTLLASVGLVVSYRNGICSAPIEQYDQDEVQEMEASDRHTLATAIGLQLAIIIGLCLLYPLQLVAHAWKRTARRKSIWTCIRIPAGLDPAPLLYPTLLPVLVAVSFTTASPQLVLANVSLGTAALPAALTPRSNIPTFSTVHWGLSLVPIAHYSPVLIHRHSRHGAWPAVELDALTLLFPLHQSLVSFLHYLTSTSLLPAEIQLLSIALINLLLFAESPYAVILRTLLWLGGLSVYLLCGRVVRWGIALARIPRWRLKGAVRAVEASQNIFDVLGRSWDGTWFGGHEQAVDSDADEDHSRKHSSPRLSIDTLGTGLINSLKAGLFDQEVEVNSAVETGPKASTHGFATDGISSKRRRNTAPNLIHSVRPMGARKRRRQSFGTPLSQSFLRLSRDQAFVRKWFYAVYVYGAVVALILVPIRSVIARSALGGFDPFGWAIGYLFADAPWVKQWAKQLHLDSWIALPPRDSSPKPLGRAEYVRQILIGEANTRLLLSAYCVAILAVGMLSVSYLTPFVEVDTRRKIFHGMMVAILLPSIYVDPAFIALALALVLSIFLLLDLLRASQLPPLSKPIAYFLTPYVDGRDLRGPVVVSHIFLLIGCAVPLWLTLADSSPIGQEPWAGWAYAGRDTSMMSGVICVGMGDAAASLIGRRHGRRKWPWTGGKSLEGSAAFAIAVTVGLVFSKVWMVLGQWHDRYPIDLAAGTGWVELIGKAGVAACVASFMEAVLTGGNDNVIVPVMLWLTVRALRL